MATTSRKVIAPDIAAQAAKGATKAVQDYLDRLTGLLVTKAGDFHYKEARNTAEELRYTWVHETNALLNKDFQAALDDLKAQNQEELQRIVDGARKTGLVLPPSFTVAALFTTTWDKGAWDAIRASRAQWHSLSESLWNMAGDAQRQVLALIEKASRDGIPYTKLKHDLSALLTEQGRGNMQYNLRRLWSTELRRNRMVAQQYTWRQMGFIQHIRLERSEDADETCPICGEAIGWQAKDFRIVPVDHPDMPPYHPWCKCTATPEEPAAADIKKWLDDTYGKNPVAPRVQPLIPNADLPAKAKMAHVPTQKEMAQAIQDANRENNMRDFDTWMKLSKNSLQKQYGWTAQQADAYEQRMHDALDKVVSEYGSPKWRFANAKPGEADGFYRGLDQTISIDPRICAGSADKMLDVAIHEYGHYLQGVLDDGSAYRNVWLVRTELNKGKQAVQDAMSALQQYSARLLTTTKDKATGTLTVNVTQQYTRSAMSDNALKLKAACDELDPGMLGTKKGTPGFQFFCGFNDLGGGTFLAGNGAGHFGNYWNRTDYLTWSRVPMAGVTEQEALNEFTTGYLLGTAEDRMAIDAVMYKHVPDLWTGLHRWIDFIIGH